MDPKKKLVEIQKKLSEHGLDGWLLFDHHGSNKFIRELLDIPPEVLITRRFFYWIPCKGSPCALLHRIEEEAVSLPGEKKLYISWIEFEKQIAELLKNVKKVAMEYCPRNANPYVSIVDGGTLELVRERGVEIVSSADLLQHFTSVLDEQQIESHLSAAKVLMQTAEKAWDLIGERLRKGKKITEYDVQQFILSEFLAEECITEGVPICAVGPNSALPHYTPTKEHSKQIEQGDFVLIDLWCKQDIPHGVYADITRVAVAATEPSPKEQQIFDIVFKAQSEGTKLVRERCEAKKAVSGAEVDDACRKVIRESGYGEFFTHRTGHSIDTSVHGAGAHLDNFETQDVRKLLPGTCFSVEPGIYLPHEFGVRLEYDILIRHDYSLHITGGIQENILCLL